MYSHEDFQQLSALAAIGLLSCEEDRELNNHLLECARCRDVHRDYAHIIQHQLPLADVPRWRIKSLVPSPASYSEIRERFIARGRTEGIDFSAEAERQRARRPSQSWWRPLWRHSLALASLAVFTISIAWFTERYSFVPRSSTAKIGTEAVQWTRENAALRSQVETLRHAIEEKSAQFGRLTQENLASQGSIQNYRRQLDDLHQQAAKLAGDLKDAQFQRAELAETARQKDTAIAGLRVQNDDLYRERADILSSRAILEAQVRDLNDGLQREAADAERERQLTTVSKDVRQLMGARNLHIMDVHDVGGGGKAAKAFGRVFYAEGQSLIFYAFDLPSGGLSTAKYTFQAWGQREPGPQSVRNLGTFEVDDHEQRRWVLKVTDSRLLTGIDSVFVTAESLQDAKEPHGKKLMYAYIVGQPNHP